MTSQRLDLPGKLRVSRRAIIGRYHRRHRRGVDSEPFSAVWGSKRYDMGLLLAPVKAAEGEAAGCLTHRQA